MKFIVRSFQTTITPNISLMNCQKTMKNQIWIMLVMLNLLLLVIRDYMKDF